MTDDDVAERLTAMGDRLDGLRTDLHVLATAVAELTRQLNVFARNLGIILSD